MLIALMVLVIRTRLLSGANNLAHHPLKAASSCPGARTVVEEKPKPEPEGTQEFMRKCVGRHSLIVFAVLEPIMPAPASIQTEPGEAALAPQR